MKRLKLLSLTILSSIALYAQSLTAFAGFDLQHYEMTDDGLWLIQAKGASGNTEEGRVTIHFLVDNTDRDIAYVNNYYTSCYYDENGNYQEATIHYYPEDMTVETTINGYEVWTHDYGFPVGDWYFAGYSSSYGSLPGVHTLTTDFQYTDQNNMELAPFTVTKDDTVHIFAIQGDDTFILMNLDDFTNWAKDRVSGLNTEKNRINGGDVVKVDEAELQTIEITESAEPLPTKTPLPTVTTEPKETKEPTNIKGLIISGIGFFAIVGGLLFLTKRRR